MKFYCTITIYILYINYTDRKNTLKEIIIYFITGQINHSHRANFSVCLNSYYWMTLSCLIKMNVLTDESCRVAMLLKISH